MSSTPETVPSVQPHGWPEHTRRSRWWRRLWDRELDAYPSTGRRALCLAIVVVATIILYYELYVPGGVSTSILSTYGMSFRFYVYGVGVLASGVGALSSLVAGLADRWGRANMVTYGLLLTALLVLFGIPNASNKWSFMALLSVVGFVEGVVLVATPALIRDFSPQTSRATALGFWTLGPVIGSLIVAVVASSTLSHLHAWQDQFTICGIVGLAVFAVALVGLRELPASLRDQLMVSHRDRMVLEARAQGLDIEAALRRPWRQMLKFDVIGPSFGAAVLLLIYYTLVGFLVIYFATVFHYSEQRANSLAYWYWGFNAGALVVVGVLSDRLRVRKPFMVIGAAGAVVMTIIFLSRATHPTTSFSTLVVIMVLLAVSLGVAFAPWFAAFTETIERRNPALMATGLAVNGWVGRGVVTLSALILPFVVTAVTPLVTYGTRVSALAVTYAPELETASAIHPSVLHELTVDPRDAAALSTAVGEIVATLHVSTGEAVTRLTDLGRVATQPGFVYLSAHGSEVEAASAAVPTQWQHWWWVCVAGEVVFVPFIFLLVGRWSPARARRDAEEHEQLIEAEARAVAAPPLR